MHTLYYIIKMWVGLKGMLKYHSSQRLQEKHARKGCQNPRQTPSRHKWSLFNADLRKNWRTQDRVTCKSNKSNHLALPGKSLYLYLVAKHGLPLQCPSCGAGTTPHSSPHLQGRRKPAHQPLQHSHLQGCLHVYRHRLGPASLVSTFIRPNARERTWNKLLINTV